MKAQAIVFTGVGKVELQSLNLPEPGPGEVALETLFSCISPGTELRSLAGKQGGGNFPFVPGYALAGRVIKRGPGATLAEGALVFSGGSEQCGEVNRCWGGHMSLAICPENLLLPIPAGVDLMEAAASKLASIPYHGLRLAHPLPEEKIAVIGLGAIGLMSAIQYAKAGCHVVACDMMESRVKHAGLQGLTATSVKGSLKETFAPYFSGADVVVDCTGVPAVFSQAMEVLRELPWSNHETPRLRYIVQGSYADSVSVPYNSAFMREVSIIFPRSEQDKDRSVIFEKLRLGSLSMKPIISDVRKPEAAQKTYDELKAPGTELLSVIYSWKN
jgi:3-hydroxyethyl bacteriochlorophyllide a dehydrogenase